MNDEYCIVDPKHKDYNISTLVKILHDPNTSTNHLNKILQNELIYLNILSKRDGYVSLLLNMIERHPKISEKSKILILTYRKFFKIIE